MLKTIRLPDSFYERRQTAGGGTVRDVMPWPHATDYVTDGHAYGIRYDDGSIDWLGSDITDALGEGAACDRCSAPLTDASAAGCVTCELGSRLSDAVRLRDDMRAIGFDTFNLDAYIRKLEGDA